MQYNPYRLISLNSVSIFANPLRFLSCSFCLDTKRTKKIKEGHNRSAHPFHPSPPHVPQRMFLHYISLRDGVSMLLYVLAAAACAVSSIPKLPFQISL
jgi:hypothetical protein